MKLNRSAVKEQLIFGYPFSKDIFTSSNKLNCKKYYFNYNGISLDDTIQWMDEIFTEQMFKIRDRFSDDTVFALGLSGGMDSRVVLHYALKAGINPICFLYGTSRPHRIALSRDYRNSLDIAKLYNVKNVKFIEPVNKNKFVERFVDNCRTKPYTSFSPPNSFFDMNKLHYDVLLTGACGDESMGSCMPNDVSTMTQNNATNYLFKRLSKSTAAIPGIISCGELVEIYIKVINFINEFDSMEDAIHSFLYGFMVERGQKNIGLIKENNRYRYSIFYDYKYFNQMFRFNPNWLASSVIKKRFHTTILPELSKIPGQRWQIPLYYQDKDRKFIRKLYYMGMFGVRWHGLQYHKWLWSLLNTNFAKYILSSSDEIFDGDKVSKLPKKFSIIAANVLKIKYCNVCPMFTPTL